MDIEKIRNEIDKIDLNIIEKLKQRSQLVVEIAKIKRKTNAPLFKPDREKNVFKKLLELDHGYLSENMVRNIYTEIMGSMKKIEDSFLKISFLGPTGTYTHQAAIKQFGNSLEFVSSNNIQEVFQKVWKDEVSYGVVPIENSIEGIVNTTLDELIEYDLYIYGEMNLAINHCLISNETNIENIRVVYSHKQALAQCKNWLNTNLKEFELKETSSTSLGVQKLQSASNGNAAIASATAAKFHNVPILKENVTDYPNNYTRFIIIGKDLAGKTEHDRTSIIFTLPHKTGSLFSVLRPIYENKINMTSIESRPNKLKLKSYIFYVELEGHSSDLKLKDALENIGSNVTSLKILGSYPIANEIRS